MRDRNVGKVRIDDLYNLVIVIGQFLKLKIKLVVSSDELHFRRGASDDDELLGEDTFYNKSASIAGSVPGCNITTVRHEKTAERTGADIKPECITNKIFHYQKMKREIQNPLSYIPFTSHSWNRYGRQERLPSPLHKEVVHE